MSKLKQIFLIVFIGFMIYLIWKPKTLQLLKLFNSTTDKKKSPQIETFIESKEENEIQLKSPTLNPLEVRQILKMKNKLIKPFTSHGNYPNNNQYKQISDMDFKNIQAYLANLLQNINVEGIIFNITPTNISPNIYSAINTNIIYLTPIELQGTLKVNKKSFGTINFNIILRGSTNTIYVPKDGVFIADKKYEMYIESFNIISVVKNNSPVQKQKGFYATADNIDMMITENKQDFNKTPQEIKIDRKANNPLTTLTELEDSEDNFDLSEIIRGDDNLIEPDSENVSSVNINY